MLKPDAVLGFVLLDIAIILVMARLVGGLFVRLGQPRVVGEIVAGVLLGPTLLGPKLFTWANSPSYLDCDTSLAVNVAPPATAPVESITTCVFPPQARGVLGLLGQIALVFFMFLVGLELDFNLLKGKAKGIALVAFGAVALPIALGFVVGPILYDEKWVAAGADGTLASKSSFTLFVAAMLSVTAFPVMARILQEKRLTQSQMGAIAIAAAAIVTVLMFLAVAVARGVAKDESTGNIALKFVLAAAFIAVMFVVVRPLLLRLGSAYERGGLLTSEMFAIIVVVLFASAYVAHKIGINVIVGGFVAGAVLPARVALFRDLSARLSEITGVVLLPIFLAFSGLNTDFTKLGAAFIVGVVIFVVAGIIGKWVGSAVAARAGGLTWTEGNTIGVLMNCRGLLVLVVALIGFEQGIISAPMQVAGVVMALVTTMMTGPLFDLFYRKLPGTPGDAGGPTTASAIPGEADDVTPGGGGTRRGKTGARNRRGRPAGR